MKVYLSGPIFGCTDEELKWREEWRKKLEKARITVIDPLRHDYRGKEENFTEIVTSDLADIVHADAVLVNYYKPSVGTAMEIVYANILGKFVYIITKKKKISPWLRYHGIIFDSLDDVIECLRW